MDRLIEKIIQKQNPTCVGLDTRFEYIPPETAEAFGERGDSMESAAKAIFEYNRLILDAVCDIVPAVKIQVAYYEMYGVHGMKAFYDTARYAEEKGLYVIADIKRNDIGATAEAYAAAYLGQTALNGGSGLAFPADSVTVNGYLGSDGIKPFADKCFANGKTAFILVKTSNASSGELQDMMLESGKRVYEQMADMVQQWGRGHIGKYGYSSLGAVVGATYPEQGAGLRERIKRVFFLIPGYGAQGGSADGAAGCFDRAGLGGVVNASRSILCAYKNPAYAGQTPAQAALSEAQSMQAALHEAICRKAGISKIGEGAGA